MLEFSIFSKIVKFKSLNVKFLWKLYHDKKKDLLTIGENFKCLEILFLEKTK